MNLNADGAIPRFECNPIVTDAETGFYQARWDTNGSQNWSYLGNYHWSYACPSGSSWSDQTKSCSTQCGSDEWPDPLNPGQCLNNQKCLQKNGAANGFPDTPSTRGFASECFGGCEFKLDGGGIGVDGVYTGVFQFSGNSCPANKPPKPEEEAKPAPVEKCEDLGEGYKSCLRADGKQCVTMKNGKASCWSPGETGTKTDENAAQKRDAGNQPIPPNAQLPNGDTLVQTGPTKTSTTTKIDKNGNTTVINTTISNYSTQHNTNAGTTNQGTTNTGAATTGGTAYQGGGTGGEGEGDEDGTSASGGGDCKTPPIVSGDAALNMVASQAWSTRCAIEAGNATKVTGDIGDCNSPFTAEGQAQQVTELRALRAQICPEDPGLTKDPGEGATDGDTDVWGEGDAIDGSSLNSSGWIGGGGSCPALVNGGGGGQLSGGLMTYLASPPAVWCGYVNWIYWVVVAFSTIAGIYLVAGKND